jgi:hypothetical protein
MFSTEKRCGGGLRSSASSVSFGGLVGFQSASPDVLEREKYRGEGPAVVSYGLLVLRGSDALQAVVRPCGLRLVYSEQCGG